MPREYKATKSVIERYKVKKSVLEKLLNTVNMIIDGSCESTACRNNNIDIHSFRNFIQNTSKFERDNFSFTDTKAIGEFATWEDALFAAIYGETSESGLYFTDEFRKNLMLELDTLTEREQKVLLLRYKDGLTLEETGKIFGVQRERIRQIEVKALRRLRHPVHFKSLCYGYELVHEHDRLLNWYLEKRNEYMREISNIKKELVKIESSIEQLQVLNEQKMAYKELFDKFCIENGVKKISDTFIEDINIDELNFSVRTYNCLRRGRCDTLNDLIKVTLSGKLMEFRNLGRRSAMEIISKLSEYGYNKEELMAIYLL